MHRPRTRNVRPRQINHAADRGGAGGRTARTKNGSHRLCPATATKAKPVQIKIGISDGVTTEVTEGLKEGDQSHDRSAECLKRHGSGGESIRRWRASRSDSAMNANGAAVVQLDRR